MAIGFEHLRGPNGEQWMGMSPPQQRSNQPTMTRRGEQNPMLSSQGGYTQPAAVDMQAYSKPQPFQNAAAAQKHQDAFVQQFLQNQAQYNQGLQSGQQPQRVDVDQVWNQAGKNIQSGAYQGNPFQTGNAQAIAGLFNQYGMAMPAGFQEQLLAALAPQSAPPMYQPQPAMGSPDLTPGTQVPGSWIVRMPQTNAATARNVADYQHTRPNVPSGWGVRDLGLGFYSIEAPGQSQADVAAWASQVGAGDLSPNRAIGHMGLPLNRPQPPMTYPGGPMPTGPAPGSGDFIDARQPGMDYRAVMVPYYNPATGETTSRTSGVVPAPGSGWVQGTGPAANSQPPMTYPGGPMAPPQMGYPGGPSNVFIPKFTNPATGLPYGQPVTGGPVAPNGEYWPGFRSPPQMGSRQPPQAPAAPNPSDPWSYPLRPGHTRGPSGEQIMTREAREAEIRRLEQESGRTYVRPKAGVTNGGWLPPAKPQPRASISLTPEQAAGMKQYMESRQASRAQPTPPRTQGTPYRSSKR
jgi:hypothetical protein